MDKLDALHTDDEKKETVKKIIKIQMVKVQKK